MNEEIKYYSCASRGRDLDTPIMGEVRSQNLEINWSGFSNSITTVSKDCYVLEIHERKIL